MWSRAKVHSQWEQETRWFSTGCSALWGPCGRHSWVEARDAAKHSAMSRNPPPTPASGPMSVILRLANPDTKEEKPEKVE